MRKLILIFSLFACKSQAQELSANFGSSIDVVGSIRVKNIKICAGYSHAGIYDMPNVGAKLVRDFGIHQINIGAQSGLYFGKNGNQYRNYNGSGSIEAGFTFDYWCNVTGRLSLGMQIYHRIVFLKSELQYIDQQEPKPTLTYLGVTAGVSYNFKKKKPSEEGNF